MATQEHIEKDTAARMELSRLANLEISKLAEAAADIYAQKLHGHEDGDEPSTETLERVYKGLLA